MSKRIKFLGVRLSANPNAKVIANAQGPSGFVNVTESGKLYFRADFKIQNGAQFTKKSENVWADDDGKFVSPADEYAEDMQMLSEAGELRGHLFTEDHDWSFVDTDGKTRDVSTITLLCFEGQSETRVFSQWMKGQAKRAISQSQANAASGPIKQAEKETI